MLWRIYSIEYYRLLRIMLIALLCENGKSEGQRTMTQMVEGIVQSEKRRATAIQVGKMEGI